MTESSFFHGDSLFLLCIMNWLRIRGSMPTLQTCAFVDTVVWTTNGSSYAGLPVVVLILLHRVFQLLNMTLNMVFQGRSLENGGFTGSSRKPGPLRFSSNMLPFKNILFLEMQPIWASFSGKRPRDISVWILFGLRFCCLVRCCCFPEILLFRDSNRKIGGSRSLKTWKEAHIG